MARYAAAFQTTSGTIAAASAEVRATSSDRPLIMELELHCVTAAAAVVGIGTPAATGVTPDVTYRPTSEDPAVPLSTTLVAVSWNGTAPTVPTQFVRRFGMRALAGCPLIVAFPRGLTVPQNGSVVLWNITANPLLGCSITVDE